MKFMVAWKIPPGCYKAAIERFLNTGAPDPTGVRTIGRWHAPGSSTGWHVVEGDAAGVAELEAVWGDLLELPPRARGGDVGGHGTRPWKRIRTLRSQSNRVSP